MRGIYNVKGDIMKKSDKFIRFFLFLIIFLILALNSLFSEEIDGKNYMAGMLNKINSIMNGKNNIIKPETFNLKNYIIKIYDIFHGDFKNYLKNEHSLKINRYINEQKPKAPDYSFLIKNINLKTSNRKDHSDYKLVLLYQKDFTHIEIPNLTKEMLISLLPEYPIIVDPGIASLYDKFHKIVSNLNQP